MREDYLSRDVSPGVVSVYVVAGLAVLVLLATTGPAKEARQTQPASLLRED
jgi:ABC-type lipoprotein release transport system permease subunit